MKRLVLISLMLLLVATVCSQEFAGFRYQAVMRDANGVPKENTQFYIIVDVVQGPEKSVVYSESRIIGTDKFGILSFIIGKGDATIGKFTDIDWNKPGYYLDITIDGALYGTSELLTVPYALYAAKANRAKSVDFQNVLNMPEIPSDVSDFTDIGSILFDGDYNKLTNKPDPGTLFSGSYLDLTDKPDVPGDFSDYVSDLSEYVDFLKLLNAPTPFSGNYNDLTDKPTNIPVDISDLEDAETLFDGKYESLEDKPTIVNNNSNDYADIEDKPFVPQDISDIFTIDELSALINFEDIEDFPALFDGDFNSLTINPAIPGDVSDFTDQDGKLFDRDFNSLTNVPPIISFDGNYDNLINKPSIPVLFSELTDTDEVLKNLDYNNVVDAPAIPKKLSDLINDINLPIKEVDGDSENELQNLSEVLDMGSDAGGIVIKNVATPVKLKDAATKEYVDQLNTKIETLKIKIEEMKSITGN
jgi:hypothetical protein